MNVYQIVTDRIKEKLQQGEIPWRKPWVGSSRPVSWERQRPYRGINQLLLDPGEYATFNQINQHGGKVKKGEKASIAVFWKLNQKVEIDEVTGEEKVTRFPILRYYKVFEINSQVEGIDSKQDHEEFDHDPVEAAEGIVTGFQDKPVIKYAPGRACYKPFEDSVSLPEIKDFPHVDEYYSTIFHELAHSTAHKKRLNRNGMGDITSTGEIGLYAKEELVAEITAAMLCGVARINNERNENNTAAYLKGWMGALQNDDKLIVNAAAQAQKAADYINGIEYDQE